MIGALKSVKVVIGAVVTGALKYSEVVIHLCGCDW